jgi:hypothetical protein
MGRSLNPRRDIFPYAFKDASMYASGLMASLDYRIVVPKIKQPSLPISTILRLDEAIRFLMLHV